MSDDLNAPLMRVASLPIINAPLPVPPVVNPGKPNFDFFYVKIDKILEWKFFDAFFLLVRKESI